MTALTEDKEAKFKDGVEIPAPVKADTKIFGGGFVCVDANGLAVPGADTAGLIFFGVAMGRADNAGGAAGDKTVVCRRRGLVKTKITSTVTQANVGDSVYLVDDQTVDLAAQTTNDILCGKIVEFIAANWVWIDIEAAL